MDHLSNGVSVSQETRAQTSNLPPSNHSAVREARMEVEGVALDSATEVHEQAKVHWVVRPSPPRRGYGLSTGLFKQLPNPSKSLRETSSRINSICDLRRVRAVLCRGKNPVSAYMSSLYHTDRRTHRHSADSYPSTAYLCWLLSERARWSRWQSPTTRICSPPRNLAIPDRVSIPAGAEGPMERLGYPQRRFRNP